MHALTKKTFEEKVLKSKKIAVVEFSGENCQPCLRLKPIMEKIRSTYRDKEYIHFFILDMKGNDELLHRFNIMTIPHTAIFYKGKVIDEMIGFKDEQTILEFLKRNIVVINQPPYFVE